MRVESLDHLVLTCRDLEATCRFYEEALGMTREVFGEGQLALKFGRQKLNLHPHPTPHAPLVAAKPEPGTADLCFLVDRPIGEVERHLRSLGLAIELGPVPRTGALGPMTSLYLRDPDGNLIELARYGS